MPEALRQFMSEPAEALRPDSLQELLPPLVPAEVNDNETGDAPRIGEQVGFEVPPGIWVTMVACYALFLVLMLAATGGGHAIFAIVISAVYVAMFFGVAKTLMSQGPAQPRSPLERYDGKLATLYGPLGRGEVVAQMLVVPGAVVLFGVAILVIRLSVF